MRVSIRPSLSHLHYKHLTLFTFGIVLLLVQYTIQCHMLYDHNVSTTTACLDLGFPIWRGVDSIIILPATMYVIFDFPTLDPCFYLLQIYM